MQLFQTRYHLPALLCPISSLARNLHRSTSLRQLPKNFAEFSNLQGPLRSRKPLTRKDAAVINEWRFLTLKQFREQNIEVKNEAFDLYVQNVKLLDGLLAVNPIIDKPMDEGSHISGHNPGSVSGLKLKLRSNSNRTENLSQRLQDIVNQGLGKLRKIDFNNGGNGCKKDELARKQEKEKSWRAERVFVLSNLLDKLNKAQNENDLRPCLEIKSQLFKGHERTCRMETEAIEQETTEDGISSGLQSNYSPPKWFCKANIDEGALNLVDAHFPSIDEMEAL
ncbi:hypothetical protein NMG60_11030180 [Bertholletia excelsa]